MRVGIYLANSSPEIGGAYTIENKLFQSFLELADKSRHNFVVFSDKPDMGIDTPKIKFVRLKHPPLESKLIGTYRRGIRFIKRIIYPDRIRPVEDYYERCFNDNGIEVMWYRGPYYLTIEIPYIATYYDFQHRFRPYFPEISKGGEWDRIENRYKILFRRASVIIAGTEEGKAQLEYFYQIPSERIKVLRLAPPQFVLEAKLTSFQGLADTYRIPEDYLFCPAQFWPHKNHANLLLALKLLRDEWNIRLPLVLTGSDKGNLSYIKGLVNQLGLSSQVFILGFVPKEDIVRLYQHAFALVLPTFFGPDNMPPLEAFALGCPVIISNVRGIEEQLGDAALLVDPQKPQEIALAIKSLYEQPKLRQELIQRGLNRAKKWTNTDYVQGLFSILDEFETIRRCWDR